MARLTEAQIILRMRDGEEFVIEDDVDTTSANESVSPKYKQIVLKAKNDIGALQVKLGDAQDLTDEAKYKSHLSSAKTHLSQAIKELSKAV
jgi:hypothetical protein